MMIHVNNHHLLAVDIHFFVAAVGVVNFYIALNLKYPDAATLAQEELVLLGERAEGRVVKPDAERGCEVAAREYEEDGVVVLARHFERVLEGDAYVTGGAGVTWQVYFALAFRYVIGLEPIISHLRATP